MSSNPDTLYIKGERDVEVTKREVTLGDILSFECSNKALIPKVKALKILKIPENGQKRYVISILKNYCLYSCAVSGGGDPEFGRK